MEFELEDRPQQMGEDEAWELAPAPARRDHSRRPHRPERQDQAVFIPEQEPGSG